MNLLDRGWLVVGVTSIVLFTAIHALTNRVTSYQLTAWSLGGGLFVCAYLVSGSIWVAVLLHFAADVTNVVALGIVGRYSIVTISPAISEQYRTAFRVVFAVVLVAVLLGLDGASVNIG